MSSYIYLINSLILLFVVFMAYWWGNQGIYSSLLHLVAVIVSGTLAFALWEVMAVKLFMNLYGPYASALGLLVVFLLLLFGIRQVMDRFLHGNVYFNQGVNMIAGGVLGLAAGILTAGIILIGLEFLPVGADIVGYQPVVFKSTDATFPTGDPGDTLWVPVDKWTASFFNLLSEGAFYSSTPLALYQPDIARQAALYRMHPKDGASLYATPDSVRISKYDAAPTPVVGIEDKVKEALGPNVLSGGHTLVVVETSWSNVHGVYDTADSTIRLAATQVRLVTTGTTAGGHATAATLKEPLGASQHTSDGDQVFYPVKDASYCITESRQALTVAWVFLIDADQTPRFLMVRHLRLDLAEWHSGAVDELVRVVGKLAVEAPPTADANKNPGTPIPAGSVQGTVGKVSGHDATTILSKIEVSNVLPMAISKNIASGFQYDKRAITLAPKTWVPQFVQRPEESVMADHFDEPAGSATVRLKLDRQQAYGLLHAAAQVATDIGAAYLEDSIGQPWYPIGYVILRKQPEGQWIWFDLGNEIKSGKEIPVSVADRSDDEIYLYISVRRGTKIVKYHMGKATQEATLDVPK